MRNQAYQFYGVIRIGREYVSPKLHSVIIIINDVCLRVVSVIVSITCTNCGQVMMIESHNKVPVAFFIPFFFCGRHRRIRHI